jgi:phenylpropionate dioxygenase-like ring-hydroxylating dioxygenase large terminal subunit
MKGCLIFIIGINIANAFLHGTHPSLTGPTASFDRSWYVVAQADEIKYTKPFKATVWGKDYVLWKTDKNTYNALEDVCSHKGAALSIGHITNNRIVCPYHGYEFNHQGNLTLVPGICFRPSPIQNIPRFAVVEKHGWIYLNTRELPQFVTKEHINTLARNIFVEPEATDPQMTPILLEQTFMTHPRIVSENSLDIMHIAFVHTFGNRAKPAPTYENPPKEVSPHHWRTSYVYESGKDSMVSRFFKMKRIDIDNEFALPHTTIARIKFGAGLVNTVVTAACPVNERETRLFVKTYRNFFRESFYNDWFKSMMSDTLNQDKAVIESIQNENMDGRFNMKYDKLQNTYRSLYKKVVNPTRKQN